MRLEDYEMVFSDTLIPLEDIIKVEAIEDIDEIAFYIINDKYRIIREEHPTQVAILMQWIQNNK